MATLEIPTGIPGLGSGVTVDIFPDGSDTADVSAGACTEATNRVGMFTYSTAVTGLKYLSLKRSGNMLGYGWAYFPAGASLVQMEESRSAALMQGAGTPIKANTKKNQGLNNFRFFMWDASTHLAASGKLATLSVMRALDGDTSYGSGTLNGVTEIGSGEYSVNLGSGDMNGDVVMLRAIAPSCDITYERILTFP